jgi:hypothetical protein
MEVLLPFLKTGLTMKNFRRDGNIPEAKDRLHIYANGELIVLVQASNTLVGILSHPIAFEYLKDFITF